MKAKIERLGGARPMQNVNQECCAHCHEDIKSRRREFSEQAWAALVVWNEVQKAEVDLAICDGCYDELREVLIDRAEEIQTATTKAKEVPVAKKPVKVAAPVAAPSRNQKVRKAS